MPPPVTIKVTNKYTTVPTAFVRDGDIKPTAKIVYIFLTSYTMFGSPKAQLPTEYEITERLFISSRALTTAFRELEDANLLKREKGDGMETLIILPYIEDIADGQTI